ncbi:MAG: alpha-mannosidase [Clostridia bacterium]|nr:alpha-mannosidase [Clostridia bacterium]
MKEVHMICNAHLDPIWQWDWQEGASAALSTFRSAVKLAEEFDYIFCHNEVTLYKYVEEYAPELFEKIRELVKKGKWHIMGGWYLQPDSNMPSGESFVRQALVGKQYFTQKFGVYPTTAINFDPFGHTRGLVQIIAKCGQDSYMFMRPYKSECTLPAEQFIWEGFAGTSIKAVRTSGYNSPLGKAAENIAQKAEKQDTDVAVCLWGVGNHGGGPSKKDLQDIKDGLLTDKNVLYIHSTPEKFFEKIQPTDRFDKTLRISMPGCYVSMGSVKRKHIKLENELYFAEKICSAASLAGVMVYPEEEFKNITEDLLNAEFHDVLPGTSIKSGEENALNILGHGILDAERLKTRAFFSLLKGQKEAAEGEFPIIVFNAEPSEVIENVECEFSLADQNWSDDVKAVIHLYDEDGKKVKCQTVKEESNLNLDWRKRIIFDATLKPMSLTRFSAYVTFEPVKKDGKKEQFVFDNDRKHVEIDKNTGLLKSYKIDGKEYLTGEMKLVMMDDNADPWAMGTFQLTGVGDNEEKFSLDETPGGVFEGMKSVQVIENGDIYLGIEAFFKCRSTRARIGYKIYKNSAAIDVDVNLFMGDVNKVVKLKIPTEGEEFFGQTAFGEDELFKDGKENVSHRYVALFEGEKAFAVINNCTYGSSYKGGNMYIPLTRGVTYCAHPIPNRTLIPGDRFTKKMDQGENDFSFRILAAKQPVLGRLAMRFNQKPYVLNAFPLKAEADGIVADVEISDVAITVEAFKKIDGEEGYVLHLLNNMRGEKRVSVRIFGKKAQLQFLPFEIKTLILNENGLTETPLLKI